MKPEHIWIVPDHHNQDSKRSPDNYKKHLNTYCQFTLCTYKQTVSSNNRSMFVIHATARKLLKPEKKIKRNILPSVLNWETSGYLKKGYTNKKQEEGTEFSDSFVRSVKSLKDGEKAAHHLGLNESFYFSFNLTVSLQLSHRPARPARAFMNIPY